MQNKQFFIQNFAKKHYERIIAVRPTLNTQNKPYKVSRSISLTPTQKYQMKQVNKNIVKKLTQIYGRQNKTSGIGNGRKYKRNSQHSWSKKHCEEQITNQNRQIFQRITNVKSNLHNKFEKKLNSKSEYSRIFKFIPSQPIAHLYSNFRKNMTSNTSWGRRRHKSADKKHKIEKYSEQFQIFTDD